MAIVKCANCGGAVSEYAENCPHCGFPVISTKKRMSMMTALYRERACEAEKRHIKACIDAYEELIDKVSTKRNEEKTFKRNAITRIFHPGDISLDVFFALRESNYFDHSFSISYRDSQSSKILVHFKDEGYATITINFEDINEDCLRMLMKKNEYLLDDIYFFHSGAGWATFITDFKIAISYIEAFYNNPGVIVENVSKKKFVNNETKCPECKSIVPNDCRICPNCGFPIYELVDKKKRICFENKKLAMHQYLEYLDGRHTSGFPNNSHYFYDIAEDESRFKYYLESIQEKLELIRSFYIELNAGMESFGDIIQYLGKKYHLARDNNHSADIYITIYDEGYANLYADHAFYIIKDAYAETHKKIPHSYETKDIYRTWYNFDFPIKDAIELLNRLQAGFSDYSPCILEKVSINSPDYVCAFDELNEKFQELNNECRSFLIKESLLSSFEDSKYSITKKFYEASPKKELLKDWIRTADTDVTNELLRRFSLEGKSAEVLYDMVENHDAYNGITCRMLSKGDGNSISLGTQNIRIPNTVDTIAPNAFANCESIKSIQINTITKISAYAFASCKSLESIQINKIETINLRAFKSCDSLKTINIKKVGVIAQGAFEGCNSIESIQIDEVDVIESDAFSGCESLKYIRIGKVKTIGLRAFENCSSLESLRIHEVNEICSKAFAGCTSLKRIILPNKWIAIQSDVFSNTAYYDDNNNWQDGILYIGCHLIYASEDIPSIIRIQKDVCSIASGAFSHNDKLQEVYFEYGIPVILDNTFSFCLNLKKMSLPYSLKKIGESAFYNCSSLTAISFPDSLTSIGDYAFKNCEKLTYIKTSKGIQSIGRDVFSHSGYYNFERHWDKGILYIGYYAVGFDDKKYKGIEVRNGTRVISDYLFYDDRSFIEYIKLPDSICYIGTCAFANHESLRSIHIPSQLKQIAEDAFSNTSIETISYCGSAEKLMDIKGLNHCWTHLCLIDNVFLNN